MEGLSTRIPALKLSGGKTSGAAANAALGFWSMVSKASRTSKDWTKASASM